MGKFKVCFIKDRNYRQQNLDCEFVKKNNLKRQQECFSAQRWKLDDNLLRDKAGVWKSVKWTLKTRAGGLVYIKNTRKPKVLGATDDGRVIEKFQIEGRNNQLWEKGEPDAQSYFTLENRENFSVPMFLTAISESDLEIRGNITQDEYY